MDDRKNSGAWFRIGIDGMRDVMPASVVYNGGGI
jgi:hypothetical protein